MNWYEAKLCERQALIFLESQEVFSSPIFIKLFMFSEYAREIDLDHHDPFMAEREYVTKLAEDFPKLKEKKGTRYTKGELHWIGYVYRALSIKRKSSSKQIYKLISPAELRDLYLTYHTFDMDYCLERLEEYILAHSKSDLEILKEVREKLGLYKRP